MFTEEIKALAQEQKNERAARNEKKATTEDRTTTDYQTWFINSDYHRRGRSFKIRIRHLVAAYMKGVPYKTVEAKSVMHERELLYYLLHAMASVDPATDHREALAAWLGYKPTYGYPNLHDWGYKRIGFDPPQKAAA